jgi:hypothetical protein
MSGEDVGLALLGQLRAMLELDPERVTEDDRGFLWWPHAHPMRFHARPLRDDGSTVVSAETRLLGEVAGTGAEFGRIAMRNARDPGLSELRFDAEKRELSLYTSVIAWPGDPMPMARRLAHAAILQAGDALRALDGLAVEFPGSRILTFDSPLASLEPIPQVEVWQDYVAAGPDRAEGVAEQVAALAGMRPAPWANVSRAPHGIDAEIACAPPHLMDAPGRGKALLRISATQSHPRMGPGLVVVLVLPPEAEPDPNRAHATAALLNEAESREWTGVDAQCAWCVHPMAGLSHAAFVPALAVEDDTAERLAWQASLRARWAVQFLERVAAMRTSKESPPQA